MEMSIQAKKLQLFYFTTSLQILVGEKSIFGSHQLLSLNIFEKIFWLD